MDVVVLKLGPFDAIHAETIIKKNINESKFKNMNILTHEHDFVLVFELDTLPYQIRHALCNC